MLARLLPVAALATPRRGAGTCGGPGSRPHSASDQGHRHRLDRLDREGVQRLLRLRERRLDQERHDPRGVRRRRASRATWATRTSWWCARSWTTPPGPRVAAARLHGVEARDLLRLVHGLDGDRGGGARADPPLARRDRPDHGARAAGAGDRGAAGARRQRRLPLRCRRGQPRRRALHRVVLPGRARPPGPRLLHRGRGVGRLDARGVRGAPDAAVRPGRREPGPCRARRGPGDGARDRAGEGLDDARGDAGSRGDRPSDDDARARHARLARAVAALLPLRRPDASGRPR